MKKFIDNHGYIRLVGKEFHQRGWIAEHRWIMQQHIGRELSPLEYVHHINGNKTDNRLENLTVMIRGDHTSHHNGDKFPNKRAGRWAENYDCCVECGKTDKVHAQGGRCFRCYDRAYQKMLRQKAGAIPSEVRKSAWAIDMDGNIWHACRDCGRSCTRHGARGLCQACVKYRQRHNGEPRNGPVEISNRTKHGLSPKNKSRGEAE